MSSDVERVKQACGDARTIPADIILIQEMFAEKNIACVEVLETPDLNAHSLISPRIESELTIVERLKKIPIQDITLAVIDIASTCPERFEDTSIGCDPCHNFKFFFGDDFQEKRAREEHKVLADKPLHIDIYLFSESGLCFVYKRASWQSLVLGRVDENLFINDEYDDELFYDVDDAAYEEHQKKAAELGKDLALASGWGLCSNHQQRIFFAEKFFDGDVSVEQEHIYSAVERAKLIFDMEILPGKVATLHEAGKTPKEIAVETGCSQAKAKRIIAQLAAQ